jgi:hypothetical protein
LTRLTLIAHSMGGLVARSAHAAGVAAGHTWPNHLKTLVCLGTPHHGAPLERAGAWVDTLLQLTPYSAPFARLGQLRSAGITDLRHGALLDSHGSEGGDPAQDPVPLPRGVRCRTIAASLHEPGGARARRWIGDGLVPLDSALGRHPDRTLALRFPRDSQRVVEDAGHFDLLGDPRVSESLLEWLEPAPRASRRARG